MENSSIEEIKIMRGLYLAEWAKIRNEFFMKRHHVSLIIHSSRSKKPFYYFNNLKSIQFNHPRDQMRFSPLIMKQKCEVLVSQLNNVIQNGHSALICDCTISSQSIIICCLILMTKFNWNLLRTFQHLNNKISKIHLNQLEINWLRSYDKYLQAQPTESIFFLSNQNIPKQGILNFSYAKTQKMDGETTSKTEMLKKKAKNISFNKTQNSFTASPNSYTNFSYYLRKENSIQDREIADFQPKRSITTFSPFRRQKSLSCKKKQNDRYSTFEKYGKIINQLCLKKIQNPIHRLKQSNGLRKSKKKQRYELKKIYQQTDLKLNKLKSMQAKMNEIIGQIQQIFDKNEIDSTVDRVKKASKQKVKKEFEEFKAKFNTIN